MYNIEKDTEGIREIRILKYISVFLSRVYDQTGEPCRMRCLFTI